MIRRLKSQLITLNTPQVIILGFAQAVADGYSDQHDDKLALMAVDGTITCTGDETFDAVLTLSFWSKQIEVKMQVAMLGAVSARCMYQASLTGGRSWSGTAERNSSGRAYLTDYVPANAPV